VNFGSVASGIEAASVAWDPLGWRASWLAEIDKFASASLAYHYPDVPNLGDMTTVAARVLAGEIPAPDVLVGGTPCQAFSVAGLRMSLADARGNLSIVFVELANAIDDIRRHRGQPAGIIVWENVPGVLNTSDNAFGCFIGGLAGCDTPISAPPGRGWTDAGVVLGPRRAVAWRVLDAQYFGLAQRRRRVFVVASARDGFDPAAVLLEWDGVRRDSAPSREAREGTAGGAAPGADGRRWPADVASTLNASFGSKQGLEDQHIGGGRRSLSLATMAHGQGGAEIAENRAPTLTCNHEAPILFLGGVFDDVAHTLRGEGFDASEDGTGRGTPLVPVRGVIPYDLFQVTAPVNRQNRDENSPCHTLARDNAAHAAIVQPVAFVQNQRDEVRTMDVAGALAAEPGMKQQTFVAQPVAFSCKDHGADAGAVAPTLRAMGHGDTHANGGGQVGMQVRRLTPRECERLQGFPDDYTRIPWGKAGGEATPECIAVEDDNGVWHYFKPTPDGPRYKALGNSMAVPVMRWIGERIAQQVKA